MADMASFIKRLQTARARAAYPDFPRHQVPTVKTSCHSWQKVFFSCRVRLALRTQSLALWLLLAIDRAEIMITFVTVISVELF